jgi:hypothetical protein
MARVVCRACEERVPEEETFIVKRFGGGSYNRAGRYYRTRVCADCAAWMIAVSYPGADRYDRWNIGRLEFGLRQLHQVVPEQSSKYNNGHPGPRPPRGEMQR